MIALATTKYLLRTATDMRYRCRNGMTQMNGTHFIVHDENDIFNVSIFGEDASNVRFRCAPT